MIKNKVQSYINDSVYSKLGDEEKALVIADVSEQTRQIINEEKQKYGENNLKDCFQKIADYIEKELDYADRYLKENNSLNTGIKKEESDMCISFAKDVKKAFLSGLRDYDHNQSMLLVPNDNMKIALIKTNALLQKQFNLDDSVKNKVKP